MDINGKVMYVYNEVGILVQRVDFSHLTDKYGQPHEVSEDAKKMIFMKTNQKFEYSVADIGVNGPEFKKAFVNVKDRITDHINGLRRVTRKDMDYEVMARKRDPKDFMLQYKYYYDEVQNFWDQYLKKLSEPKLVEISYTMNDKGDVLVRLKPLKVELDEPDFEEFLDEDQGSDKKGQDSIYACSFFFYIPADGDQSKEFIYYDSKTDSVRSMIGGQMNNEYIFFWSTTKIFKIQIDNRRIEPLALRINTQKGQTLQIKRIRCSSDAKKIGIRLT